MSDIDKERELVAMKIRLAELEAQKKPAPAPRRGGFVRYVLPLILIFIVGVIVTVAVAPSGPQTSADAVDRIDASCRREYGPDPEAVNRCKIALDVRLLDKIEADKAERAARGAGQ